MNALILNGRLKANKEIDEVNKLTYDILLGKGYEVESILLQEKKIGECTGCFGCWVRTPGICVIDDFGRMLAEKIMKNDLVIWLTPVVYGGYSSEMKKGLDRIIPLLLPFFEKIEGEIHHKKRYDRYPRVVVLGLMEDENQEIEEIFLDLIIRNSLNWYNSFTGGTVGKNLGNLEKQLHNYLSNGEVVYDEG
ncbi:flavodoxin family protein [Alkaliphilus transvaalensis]|uniref:flavodoxin family protein n=1 Tax=Alkaliphilus transvaalensis TaxID=114628 RepID=UPI00047CCBB0|nr:NAD(P)H-dependent oxidoreductase [Alkaliphilus transvaalensis]